MPTYTMKLNTDILMLLRFTIDTTIEIEKKVEKDGPQGGMIIQKQFVLCDDGFAHWRGFEGKQSCHAFG